MPSPGFEEVKHETIESPYRISWKRVGKLAIPTLLLTLALSFWFVYIYIPSLIEPPKEPIKIPDTKTTTPSAKQATSSAKNNETVDWVLYKNTKYKYSFKYPLTFFVAEGGKEVTDLSQVKEVDRVSLIPTKYRNEFKQGVGHLPSIHIEIANDEGLSLEDWLDKYSTTAANYLGSNAIFIDVKNKTIRTVDGQSALQFKGNHATSADELVVLIKRSNKVYQVHATISLSNDDLSNSLDKILSTFRFD